MELVIVAAWLAFAVPATWPGMPTWQRVLIVVSLIALPAMRIALRHQPRKEEGDAPR